MDEQLEKELDRLVDRFDTGEFAFDDLGDLEEAAGFAYIDSGLWELVSPIDVLVQLRDVGYDDIFEEAMDFGLIYTRDDYYFGSFGDGPLRVAQFAIVVAVLQRIDVHWSYAMAPPNKEDIYPNR